MGLTGSHSMSTYITLRILRSILGIDFCPQHGNGEVRPSEILPQKTKSLNEETPVKFTKEASVETTGAEVARKLQSEFQERYNWLVEQRKCRSAKSVVVPAKSIVAVMQQTMTEQTKKMSRRVETDSQTRAEKETETPPNSEESSKLSGLYPTKTEPWFVSQWYQSVNGMRYGITIDTNDPDIMSYLEAFSSESSYGLEDDSEAVAQLSFNMKTGEEVLLRFNKWDPRTLEVLTQAMVESTGHPPTLGNKIEAKQIYSFVFVDKLGHKICCSLDMNNARVLKKLRMMEEWALEIADACDLFDIKMETARGSTTTFQLDLKNVTTIKNLKALKEESLTGKSAKLTNPIRKKQKVQELLVSDLVAPTADVEEMRPATVELFSPYTGAFTAVFDLSDPEIIATFGKFNKQFRGSPYQYFLTLETPFKESYEIKLDMTNPKVVYELIMMTRKYSTEVIRFDPKLILNNLITLHIPEDNAFLTLDISRSIVYGSLFEISNRKQKGAELRIPCKGRLIHLYVDVTNPHTINKIRSFGLATIVPNTVQKISMLTLIFLNTTSGYKPISLDLADRKNVIAICKVIRNQPVGETPTYIEILDDTGQFITVSIDLTNPKIIECLTNISKAAWFISINAIQTPYFTVCLPFENRYKAIRVKLKPVIIDEISKTLDKYCPDYTLLDIFDARRKCSIIYIDPTVPNLIHKFSGITNAVQILPPIDDNAVTIYNPTTHKFIDIDLSLTTSTQLLLKLEEEYRANKPLTVIKYYSSGKEMFVFVNVDDHFFNEVQSIRADLGRHIRPKADVRENYVLKVTDHSGTSISLRMNLANNQILRELDRFTNSEDFNIDTIDVYGYPIKVKLDKSNAIVNKLITLNEEVSRNFTVT